MVYALWGFAVVLQILALCFARTAEMHPRTPITSLVIASFFSGLSMTAVYFAATAP